MKYIYRPESNDFVLSSERMAMMVQRLGQTKEKCQEQDDRRNNLARLKSREIE